MAKISLNNISLTYPIYGSSTRSLKRDIANLLIARKSVNSTGISHVRALKNVSFTLNNGDRLGLIGHNGAGKTTLLKVLSGIYDISHGDLKIVGSISSLLGNTVGMQPDLTGYENIKLCALIKGYSRDESQQMIDEISHFTELAEFLNLPVKKYSSGMQARLAFGISTAIQPDILLIDEVIGTGDAHFINKAKKRMNSLILGANIMVLASHSIPIIKQFCNKVLWLDGGEVKEFGDVDSVIEQYLEMVEALNS